MTQLGNVAHDGELQTTRLILKPATIRRIEVPNPLRKNSSRQITVHLDGKAPSGLGSRLEIMAMSDDPVALSFGAGIVRSVNAGGASRIFDIRTGNFLSERIVRITFVRTSWPANSPNASVTHEVRVRD